MRRDEVQVADGATESEQETVETDLATTLPVNGASAFARSMRVRDTSSSFDRPALKRASISCCDSRRVASASFSTAISASRPRSCQ